METDNWQIKADLEDLADLSQIEGNDGYVFSGPGRSQLLQMALGLDESDIHSASSGGYQGTKTYVFDLDGLLWVVKDSYGSCSLCDGLISARRADEDGGAEHIREYAEGMMRNGLAFESKEDAVQYVTEHSEEGYSAFGWPTVAEETIANIDTVDY